MARKTTRLYYGVHAETGERLYWTLKVRNATKTVNLNGTVLDAMKGEPGVSIGCHLSETGKANKDKFGHPALYISFTKSIALVVTKIRNGKPAECVRYRHNYARYVDLNDCDPAKRVVKQHPEMFNRQFTLHAYKESKAHWQKEYGRKETGQRSRFQMARGELARMKKAGLVLQTL
jgi:hypothetical protein